jgi:hypothetical protein
MITHGTGWPSRLAFEKYAGSVVPSKGTSTRVVTGSAISKTLAKASSACW